MRTYRDFIVNVPISTGTLRVEDLILTFWEYLPSEYRDLIFRNFESTIVALMAGAMDDDEAEEVRGDLLIEIIESLEDLAAKQDVEFRTEEGDGASYGFWSTEL